MDKYFLAANSKDGFFSRFNELTTYKEIEKFYIIKAGPGTGKSTFMKKIANYLLSKDYDAEYIYCSSDSNSLDGVISKKAKFAICDGTAPHVTEPSYPGAFETYLNFAPFWDEEFLMENISEIKTLTDTISKTYTSVYKFLDCAGVFQNELFSLVISSDIISSVKKRADGIVSRELKPLKTVGKVYERFLSGITPQGVVTFKDTLLSKSDKVYSIYDNFGLSHFMLSSILESATDNGYTVYKFLCPLNPEKIDHLYIEELNLSFITTNSHFKLDEKVYRNILLDNYVPYDVYSLNKDRIKFLKRQVRETLDEAISSMQICKKLHDDLEEIYIQSMDFSKLDDVFDEIIKDVK